MSSTKELKSVHDFALAHNLDLTGEQARAFSESLAVISDRRGLTVSTKQHKTVRANPNPTSKVKRIHQYYSVKSFDPSLAYEFTQLCILYGLLE